MRLAICCLAAGLLGAGVAAQTGGGPTFIHPRDLQLDYCVTRDLLAEFNIASGEYELRAVDGSCFSTVGAIAGGALGVIDTVVAVGNCQDGKQNIFESGIDCGGSCPAQCVECIDPWTTTYWPIAVPTAEAEQIGPRLLQLADEQLFIRSYDTLFEFADDEGVLVTALDTSDEIIAAVAWFAAEHMNWLSDSAGGPNRTCINTANGLGYDAGWDFPIPASYTVNYTGLPACYSCGTDFCGDCEDHAILRQALAKRIGISSKCVWDAIDLNDPARHEYNVVLYRSKYRLMDYGEIDTWLASHTSLHETENNWNYVYGPRRPDAGNLAEDFTYNYPLSGPLATPSKVDCSLAWDLNTYYEDTCP